MRLRGAIRLRSRHQVSEDCGQASWQLLASPDNQRQTFPGRASITGALPDASCTGDHGFAWLPTGRVGAEPVGGLSARPVVVLPHIHTPGEDAAVRAVDGPL